jgi:lipid-A-disaccharide synthase
VGHPLVDEHFDKVKPKEIRKEEKKVLGLFPGSRKHEIEQLLPDMLKTSKILFDENKINKVIIAKVNNISPEIYQSYISNDLSFVELQSGDTSKIYNSLDVAITKSGTSTLETAYYQVPFVIVYRVSKLTWFLGNMLVKLDSIGLANIVAGKKIVDELLQNEFTPSTTAKLISGLLTPVNNKNKRKELQIIKEKLGGQGASKRAAEKIKEFISKM